MIVTSSLVEYSNAPSTLNRLRPDEVVHENARDRYQENAPAVEEGLYLVPRVIE